MQSHLFTKVIAGKINNDTLCVFSALEFPVSCWRHHTSNLVSCAGYIGIRMCPGNQRKPRNLKTFFKEFKNAVSIR